MLLELPRLTNSLRDPFDADQAYLQRKFILQNHLIRSSANSQQESELARKIVYRWDEATIEVRQAYRQFIAAVAELIDRELVSEEFREVALAVYRLFSERLEEDGDEDWRRIGETKYIHHKRSPKSLARLQPADHGQKSQVSGSDDDLEFGADLVFHPPARFLVDVSLEDDELLGEESTAPPPLLDDGWFDHGDSTNTNPAVDDGHFNLIWLRDACDKIVKESSSQLSGDELAMAICRVLDLDKPGDEIAGDLLDLVGDSAFETVQDLITTFYKVENHRKVLVDAVHHGLLVMKSDKKGTGTQSRMPSYGTQVTVQTESERQIDKIRRKEEKKHRRGTDHGVENDLSALSFSSLLHASEKKSPFDDLIGRGEANTLAVTSLPQGTVRKHHKGYEEVIIPPIPTAPMKPGETLIEIKELDDFAQAAFHGYKSLNRIQSRIFQTTYNSNENILVSYFYALLHKELSSSRTLIITLVCAPTGAGKTNIAMIAVLHEALAAEVTKTFSHRLAPLNMTVKELTGDMQLSKNELEETQMIVTTPEKWDVITRKSSDMALSMLVKLLIIDEVHLLNDDRGPVIEALVARTLRQEQSMEAREKASGSGAAPVVDVTHHKGIFQKRADDEGVGTICHYQLHLPTDSTAEGQAKVKGKVNKVKVESTQTMIRIVGLSATLPNYLEVVESLRQGHQAMVFVHSRKDTGKTAEKLRDVLKSRNKELVQLFEHGVGIHHAGMLRADRGLTERLFSEGLLKVLVCTATLAWGVNLPAHTVVIKGTQIYDPKAGGWRDLGMLDVMQIFGRAGRPQFDKSGEGIIITSHDKLAYYLRLLTSQLPIESQWLVTRRHESRICLSAPRLGLSPNSIRREIGSGGGRPSEFVLSAVDREGRGRVLGKDD
ncbi:hypothetical protein RJ639_006650 [Escallonia herrerae]|uniref:Activating signal cointegrator 1 complex subunit 3 n=1 Tax=Escallonia herrerae TaxID=1293975 RepID=A0AA89AUS7_9ASTE|nr:hypothetical protein RJ639_006650 [Escallonia herrerae]